MCPDLKNLNINISEVKMCYTTLYVINVVFVGKWRGKLIFLPLASIFIAIKYLWVRQEPTQVTLLGFLNPKINVLCRHESLSYRTFFTCHERLSKLKQHCPRKSYHPSLIFVTISLAYLPAICNWHKWYPYYFFWTAEFPQGPVL